MASPASTFISDRPGESDYYLRLAERRLAALSPEQSSPPRQRRRKTSIGTEMLCDLLKRRGTPGAVLAGLEVDYWMEVLSIYEDEIGLQYPFLDMDDLRRKIKRAKQDRLGTETLRTRGGERIEDLALMVHAIVCILADPEAGDLVNTFAEDVYVAAMGRCQLNGANKDDLSLLILSVPPSLLQMCLLI